MFIKLLASMSSRLGGGKLCWPLLLCLPLILPLSGCISLIAPKVTPELAALKPGQYKLDPNHASLVFKIEHLGLSTYVGRFNQLNANLDFTPDNMAAAKLEAEVDIASIDVNNLKLEQTLQNSTWFDSEQFPKAYFISESVSASDNGEFVFHGKLTLHGITRPVSFNARFHGGADNWMTGKYTLGFSAYGSIKRADFDMASYIPIVGNDVQLEIHAEFLRE
ncbi:YceI family protein [Shewanella sp. SR44-3]|uniref:YceI family protein n=1 Tax=Shewanella sp. SR44-3 TaxID=2760936 RepID=UPI0015FA860F|nr:YceI family protein [Shewanella sp. SR44-3]MBB1268950.1 YceI family protein [Shewanella sp. SR44-3]